MVQRKVPNKLGIQAENVKSEKLLVNHLKPSSQHLDIKNKGADLKKKMKKSGSFKRPEFDRSRSATMRKQVQQPGKPPPLLLPAPAATPKKQSPIKAMADATPNYMKSTTSSDARKERAQVGSQSPQTFPDGKRSIRRNLMNSKNNSAPGNKPARTLARTSSLKLVRTLTKTPSFKPSRASAKKHSSVILSQNLDVQKATCSSTLKGHKFPDYLMLSPGATEAEGTSIMKVCPYAYCSLNGHHHEPLPPLKCFLSARRRILKAQRSIKLGCLSPRGAKPVRDIMREIEAVELNFDGKPPLEDGSDSSKSSPLIQKESAGFFIEIYSKGRENYQNNQDATDASVTDQSIGVSDEKKANNEEAEKSHTSKLADLEIESHESLHQSKDVSFVDKDAEYFYAEQNKNREIAEEVYTPNLDQGMTKPDFLNLMYELETESTPSIQSEEADLETSDMDWEAGLYCAPYPFDGAVNRIQINHVIDLEKANSALDNAFLDEVVFKSEEAVAENCGENLPDEIMQESVDDETASKAWFGDEEAIKRPSLISEDKGGSKPEDITSSTDAEIDGGINNSITTKYEDVAAQRMWNREIEDHHDMGTRESENPYNMPDNMNENLKNSIGTQTDSEDFCNMSQVLKRSIGTQTDIEDDLIEACCFTNKVLDGSMIAEEGKENIDASIPFIGLEDFTVCQDTDEPVEHTGTAVHEESQLGAITSEGEPNKTLVSDVLPNQGQDCSSGTQSTCSSDDLESLVNANDETTKTTKSVSLEDQTDSKMTAPSFTGNADQNIHNTQVSNTEDASGTRIKTRPAGSSPDEELAVRRITKGTSKAVVENNEITEFNPRAPNFLPVEPHPEAEKVDLRHLMLDENRNTEEWMLDHALQQAVTKLAPACKRKVALLVEAFETILPIPKHGTHLRHTPTVFPHVRQIQACS